MMSRDQCTSALYRKEVFKSGSVISDVLGDELSHE